MALCTVTAGATGQVIVWGDNSYGQTNVPAGATNVIALAAGDYHCLGLRADGTVVAWGGNYSGQTNVPSDLTNAVSIAAGSWHSLALRRDGTVALWGHILPSFVNTVPPEATNVVGLALGPGAQHALVVKGDGTVLDWGNPNNGLTNIPPKARNIVAVAAGSFHSIALRSDGQVVAWGDNSQGQINVPSTATNVVAIAAGWYGSAALRADGTVLVWGPVSSPPPFSGFTNVVELACPFNSGAISGSLLAVRRDGTMTEYSTALPKYPTNTICTVGAGSYDGLALGGSGPPTFAGLPANRTVASGARAYFRAIAAGALPMSYQWTCNGTNITGATNTVLTLTNVQPAISGTYYSLVASNVLGMATNSPMILNETPSEVYLRATTTSAVLEQTVTFTASVIGQGPLAYQWLLYGTNLLSATNSTLTITNAQFTDAGAYSMVVSNSFGLVTNALSLSVVPSIITNLPQNQIIFPGGTVLFGIGVEADIPVMYQWQFNGTNLDRATNNSLALTNVGYTQAGTYTVIFTDAYESVTNNATLSVEPVAAWGNPGQQGLNPALTDVVAIASGELHGLALTADGLVMGWGYNSLGQAASPPGLSNVIAIAAGNNTSLALKGDNTVIAWGHSSYGETVVPSGLSNVVAIAAGDFHNLALKSDGTVVAWGNNQYGQTNVPAGLTNVAAISAGEWNSMALKADGTVVAWGAGTTSASDPNFGQSIVPANLSNVVQISTAGPDDLALRTDGSLVGWGINDYGEDAAPSGLSNIVAISAGHNHTIALKSDGTVAAWGFNSFGETNVPVGLTNVVAISSKGFHSVALVGNGVPILRVPISNPQWSANGFSLSVPTQSGRVYALEYKNSPSDINWTALPLVAGTGGVLTLTDPATGSAQRFYRVRRW